MSLLTQLQNIDLSRVVSAKASISVSVKTPRMEAILKGGAAGTALASLGGSLQQLRAVTPDADALIRPLLNALAGLAGQVRAGDVPAEKYLRAIQEGAALVAKFVSELVGDPSSFGRSFGFSLNEALRTASSAVEGMSNVVLEDVPRFRQLLQDVEQGVPREPSAFARVAVEVLLPFPLENISGLRDLVGRLHVGLGALALPPERTAGLKLSLDAVVTASASANLGELKTALQNVARVRAHTIGQLNSELREFVAQLDRIRVPDLIGQLTALEPALRIGDEGILEFLETWRVWLAEVRQRVQTLDPEPMRQLLPKLLDELERLARRQIGDAVDAQVRLLEQRVRDLLGHLRLRALRNEITAFLLRINQAVRDAHIERFAVEARNSLDTVATRLADAGGLSGEIQSVLRGVQAEIDTALGGVFEALAKIKTEVDAVAGVAQGVLGQAADALEEFQRAVTDLTARIEQLPIESSADEVVQTLHGLREKAEQLLSVAPLPEPMRPLVEQLIATLEGVDFEEVFKPIDEALAKLHLPDGTMNAVTEPLAATRDAMNNLIPAQLIADIDREVKAALDAVKGFNPAQLLPDVTKYLQEAAEFVQKLKLSPELIATAHEPFQKLLDAIDAAHPNRLLAPVIEAYDAVMGQIRLPGPEEFARSTTALATAAGDSAASSLTKPINAFAGGGSGSTPGAANTGTAPAPSFSAGFRPGDIVRLFGYLPNKLREALRGLEAGAAGAVVREIDAHCGGLARDLRAIPASLWHVEEQLERWSAELFQPFGQAQMRALFAAHARVQAGGASASASISLDVLASVSPGALQEDLRETMALVRRAVRRLTEGPGSPGHALESAASALERCSIAKLGANLDGWLAALDPEPIAKELDLFVEAILRKAPEFLNAMETELQAAVERMRAILEEFNPGAQVQKFLRVIDVFREELQVLDPRRLAAELSEIHAAIRASIAAYDPALFAASLNHVIDSAAQGVLALNPATLLGDVSFLGPSVAKIEEANPAKVLASVGASLHEVGERLAAIDPAALLTAVEALPPRVSEAVRQAAQKIRDEIVALLKALRYASGGASVEVEASASIG